MVSVIAAGAVVAAAVVAGALGVAAPAGATTTIPVATQWAPVQAPLPSNMLTGKTARVTINATSCPTQGFCVAVGQYKPVGGGVTTSEPVVELYAAGSWSRVTVPLPTDTGPVATAAARLYSVSCAAPTSCAAVGNYSMKDGRSAALIDTLSGSKWTVSVAPLPAGAATKTPASVLGAVSCPAAGSCIALGTYWTAALQAEGMADTLSGGQWTGAEVVLPANASKTTGLTGFYSSISCTSTTSCVGVGTFQTATTSYAGLISTLAASGWKSVESPLPSNALGGPHGYSHLGSVACSAPGTCAAVGDYVTSDQDLGLIDTESAGTWSALAAPVPSSVTIPPKDASFLNSVACPAVGTCVAVGDYRNNTNFQYGLIDTLSGTTWSGAQAPNPPNSDGLASLTALGCSSAGSCTAGGTYDSTPTVGAGFFETLSGTTWALSVPPLPAGAVTNGQTTTFRSISCFAGSCAAVGHYVPTGSANAGLLETTGTAPAGYFEAASDGGIFAFTVPFHGSMGGKPLNAPIVAAVADPLTGGYYEVASDGGIFAFTAPFHGSMGGKPLNEPIVGMTFDTRTGGYYLVASDGGLFAFTAPFHGSMGGKPLNEPIVGMAFDPLTGGYWEVASDGGLFAFTAPFLGSMGGKPLNQPIVGMTFDTLTNGYYEVATDGGLFAFTAPFQGSMGGKPLNEPVVGMAYDYGTGGYWEVASDGGLFAFNAPFQGSMGGKPLNEPIVTMALG